MNGSKRHQSQMGIEKKQIMSLLDFQSRVAASLLQEKKPGPGRRKSDTVPKNKKSVSAPLPTGEVRYDCVGHFPVYRKTNEM